MLYKLSAMIAMLKSASVSDDKDEFPDMCEVQSYALIMEGIVNSGYDLLEQVGNAMEKGRAALRI